MVRPITLKPFPFKTAAATELSTPPDIATTTLVSSGLLFMPNSFMVMSLT